MYIDICNYTIYVCIYAYMYVKRSLCVCIQYTYTHAFVYIALHVHIHIQLSLLQILGVALLSSRLTVAEIKVIGVVC